MHSLHWLSETAPEATTNLQFRQSGFVTCWSSALSGRVQMPLAFAYVMPQQGAARTLCSMKLGRQSRAHSSFPLSDIGIRPPVGTQMVVTMPEIAFSPFPVPWVYQQVVADIPLAASLV